MTEPATTSKPKPRFVTDHTKLVTLGFPLEYDGKVYDAIRVKPITVSAYTEHAASGSVGRLPMFEDQAGALVPVEVMDALSLRDMAALNEAASAFLPVSTSQPDEASP